jgi:putative acetyltransferase
MNFKIVKYRDSDLEEVSSLVRRVSKKYLFQKDHADACISYINLFDPKKNTKLAQEYKTSQIFLIAKLDGKIVGMARGRKIGKLGNLYIEGRLQRNGIGTKLLQEFERNAKKKGWKKMRLNSSLKAVEFYKKNGYKKSTNPKKGRHGLIIQPMRKIL